MTSTSVYQLYQKLEKNRPAFDILRLSACAFTRSSRIWN